MVVLQDKNPAKTAADDFRKVATAYEILTDNETRASYDYALAHPKEHLYNQYRFYRNRMYKEMKIPAQYTVTAVILIWSAVQYFTKEHMYQNVRSATGTVFMQSHEPLHHWCYKVPEFASFNA